METATYIQNLLKNKGIVITDKNKSVIEKFTSNDEILTFAKNIMDTQNMILDKYKIANRIFDIQNIPIILPNATVKKQYSAKIDFEALKLDDIVKEEFLGLDELGLKFNLETDTIEGVPLQSGDIKLKFLFKIKGESEENPLNEKLISLVINPNPKDLWQEKESDKTDIFYKDDNVKDSTILGEKILVVSSKRGRSHANVGSFRDDDFAYKFFEKTGWSLVVVSDGAGSATLARKGSQLACNSVVDFFENHLEIEKAKEFEDKIMVYSADKTEENLKEINLLSKQILYKATVYVHNQLKEFAENTYTSNPDLFNNPKAKSNIDYFHSTLIFALFKKYDFGYIIQTFGVGDCPIAVMNKDKTETTLLNWLDVGEHGGGTRFITQPDIFHSTERPMATRFNLKVIDDFSYLFLMTDGIYDAKFVVEANLEKNEKWIEFLEDLDGKNEDNSKVNFDLENENIKNELDKWMDFWSVGNHDDRTLAIIY